MENTSKQEQSSADAISQVPNPDRRRFLKYALFGTAGLAANALLTSCGIKKSPVIDKPGETLSRELLAVDNSIIQFESGTEISLQEKGLWDVPDERIPYVTFPDGERVYFLPGRASSYAIRGSQNKDLTKLLKDPKTEVEKVIGPDLLKPYKNGYCTINNVFRLDTDNPYHLFAVTANEQHEQLSSGQLNWQRFTASIGWAQSQDGGKTWEDQGSIIKGQESLPPEKIPSGLAVAGAGQPSSIMKDGYLYIYHIDWPAQIKVKHPYQIFLARSKVEKFGLVGAMEFWTRDGFKQEVFPEEQIAVIKPPLSVNQESQAALPSVSFNKAMNKFLAVYETQYGFCLTKSEDGIRWDDGEMILRFPQPQYPHHRGDIWYSNPTLISPSESTDTETNDKGYLIYSKGVWETQPHQPVIRPFNLK